MLITTTLLVALQSANFTATAPSQAQPVLGSCMENYSCSLLDSASLGYISGVDSAAECRRECDRYNACAHFTYFSAGRLEGTCFLLSSCSQRFTRCRGSCTSGPACSACSECSQGSTHSSRILSILRAT